MIYLEMCGDKNTQFMSNGGEAHNFVVAFLNSNFSAGKKVQIRHLPPTLFSTQECLTFSSREKTGVE